MPGPIEQRNSAGQTGLVPGVHSDVGGGYSDCGLSNTTLLWMTDEAKAAGLVFDEELLASYVDASTNTKLNSH
ncbi:MAG: hypothetical protein WKF73_18440 [Nocardioidaceae bacterium]